MTFHPLSLADRATYEDALTRSPLYNDYLGSELNFQNLYAWRRYDAIRRCVLPDGTLLTRGERGGIPFFCPPIARDEEGFVAAVDRLERLAVDENIPFLLRGMTARLVEVIRRAGRHYRVDEERNLFEYLYDSASLRTLSGNKYHAKRNFFNRFLKNGDHTFRAYRPEDRETVETMLRRWEQRKLQAFEHESILDVLDHLGPLGCFADLLFVGDRLAAFAIGTFVGKAGLVLFEKADTGYPGVYAAINCLFANAHYGDVAVINRQEDVGIPELRKAKLSYNPIGFIEKYALVRDHLTAEETLQLRHLYTEAFPDSPSYVDYFFRVKFHSDNVVFHKREGTIVSALHLVPKTLSVHGTLLPVPFVAAAATLIRERGQGLMRQILRQALGELYNRKVALCALSPFAESFYAPFGFATVARTRTVRVSADPGDGRTYRPASPADLDLLDAAYRTLMADRDVYVERRLDAWQDLYDEVTADGGVIMMILEGDRIVGYFSRFGDVVEELVLPPGGDPSAFSGLDGLTIDGEGGADDDARVMVRIVDVVRFLETYPYDPGVTFDARVRIVDDFFPQNAMMLEWTVAGGVPRLREIEVADTTITISALAAMAFDQGKPPFRPVRTLIFDRW